MLFSRIRYTLIGVFAFLASLCFAFALHSLSVTAAGTSYLEIKPGDFSFKTYTDYGETYTLTFEYTDDSNLLPHYVDKASTRYVDEQVLLVANETKNVKLHSVTGSKGAKTISFVFFATTDDDHTAFSSQITSFTFFDGLIIEANADYRQDYPDAPQGIKFVGNMTFEKKDNSWVCLTNDENEDVGIPEPDLDGTNEYTAYLQYATSAPVWDSAQKTLSVNISLPYTAKETLSYMGALEAVVEGADYDGEITATQEVGTHILRLDFYDAEVLYPGVGLSLTLHDTTLTNERLGNLTLEGSMTYYGYFDGVWREEKLFEIIKTIGSATQSERLAITETSYTFPALDSIADKLALGWIYNDGLYKTGETLALSKDSRVLYITAVYVGFSLERGASIRYDENLDSSGIRFEAHLQEDGYANVAPFISGLGTILMPADKLVDGREFVYENYDTEDEGNAKILNAMKKDIDFGTGGLFKLYTTIVKLNASNYNRTYCARGYITLSYKSGQTRLWTENIEKRSIYEVASKLLTAPREETKLLDWQIRILESYVNGVANISYDAATGTATVISAATTPSIQAVEVSVSEYGTIKLVLTASVSRFLAVTYNGKRVNAMGQTYDEESGKIIITFSQSNLTA